MDNKNTRSTYFGAIAKALLGQSAPKPATALYGSSETAIISQGSSTALSVRGREHSGVPALIRPKEANFIPLSAMAVPGMIRLISSLFNNEVTIGKTKRTTIIDPGTAAVLDVCGRVSLVKFDLLTRSERILIQTFTFDPILPVIAASVLLDSGLYELYRTSMSNLAMLIEDFAKRPSKRYDAALAVTNVLSVIDSLPLTVPERQFSAYHLKGLMDNPVAYM